MIYAVLGAALYFSLIVNILLLFRKPNKNAYVPRELYDQAEANADRAIAELKNVTAEYKAFVKFVGDKLGMEVKL